MVGTLRYTPSFAPPMETPVSGKLAAQWILNGKAAGDLQVRGPLEILKNPALETLPPGIRADSINLSLCKNLTALPAGTQARRLNLSQCTALRDLPAGLHCHELNLSETAIRELPDDLRVEFRLDLSDCTELERLPVNLKVGTLILRNCTALEALPEGLDVAFLDISGCIGLQEWPRQANVRFGRLNARGCMQLTSLPDWLTEIAQLDLVGCDNITELPPGLRVGSWIDIANTGIRALPAGAENAQIRWRSVPIDKRIAFAPETISAQEVLNTRNAELRRVLLERMGYEAFVQEIGAKTIGQDTDAGGERRLLWVEIPGDEPLVCLSVFCPSTGRQYMLRVPPLTRTCRQAAAWLAGFDHPDAYQPIAET